FLQWQRPARLHPADFRFRPQRETGEMDSRYEPADYSDDPARQRRACAPAIRIKPESGSRKHPVSQIVSAICLHLLTSCFLLFTFASPHYPGLFFSPTSLNCGFPFLTTSGGLC